MYLVERAQIARRLCAWRKKGGGGGGGM